MPKRLSWGECRVSRLTDDNTPSFAMTQSFGAVRRQLVEELRKAARQEKGAFLDPKEVVIVLAALRKVGIE